MPRCPTSSCSRTSNDEVASIVRLCNAARIPVIAFGVGTSLEGHVAALYGGVCLDLSQMNRVLAVNDADLDCRVQAGVTREQLNAELKGTGLFFPIDSGRERDARRHGVDARVGDQRRTLRHDARERARPDRRHRRRPDRPYRQPRAQVERRLRPHATVRRLRRDARHHHRGAAAAVRAAGSDLGRGLPVSRPEERRRHGHRGDAARHPRRAHRAARRRADGCVHPLFAADGFAAKPTLFFEFHGTDAGRARAGGDDRGRSPPITAAASSGGRRTPEDRSRLWKARHNAYYAALALAPGKQAFATDACVPISRLTDCVLETQADVVATGLIAPIVGHVGDGNFHLVVLFDPASADERGKAEALAARVSLRAISDGRHVHRRARHRRAQARRAGRRAWRRHCADAGDQARARPARHPEPGQDGAARTFRIEDSSMFKLYIGNKNYSSWSLRGWLVAKLSGEPFEEVAGPARRADAESGQPRVLAVRSRALPARGRHRRLGFDGDRRSSRGAPSRHVARRSGRARVGARDQRRDAFGLLGACAAK